MDRAHAWPVAASPRCSPGVQVLGGIICVVPIPVITQSLPGLDIEVTNLALRNCSTESLRMAPVDASGPKEQAGLGIAVAGLQVHIHVFI